MRKSSCVNARGILPAVWQVIAMLVGMGVPHPVMVGGYPIQPWWGVPHPVMMVVPHPVMVEGIPSSHGGGGGVPHPVMVSGYPPPSRPGWGTSPIQTWQGYPPTPPTIQTWPGYPPPSNHQDLAGVPSLRRGVK